MGADLVRIKGTRNGLVIVLDPNREFDEIKNNLLIKMNSAKGFFKGAKYSFFQGHHDIPGHQIDELDNICRQFGLVPNTTEEISLKKERTETTTARTATPLRSLTDEGAVMIRRSLRSGQHISYQEHIVVLGDVHPGAEVVSDGNILIMGSCRGTVHAGVNGDRDAKVIAWRLAPTVLSIAGRRFAPEVRGSIPAGCQLARLTGQEIVFEQYQGR